MSVHTDSEEDLEISLRGTRTTQTEDEVSFALKELIFNRNLPIVTPMMSWRRRRRTGGELSYGFFLAE